MARTQLSFASCNLYNINLPGLSVYSDRDGWDQKAYDKKVKWTGSILSSMVSDVWGFQELWHRTALDDVFKASGLRSKYKLLVPKNHQGHIVCAGAVRKEILVGEPEWIDRFPPEFILRSGGDDAQTSGISVSIDRFSRPIP